MSRAQELLLKLESSINPNQPVPNDAKPQKHKSTHGSSKEDVKSGWGDDKNSGPQEPDKPYEPKGPK